ncbi:serine/threonine-protein kinase [Roseimaritima ulvae]|uniref:Protein kinase domain-containing protein n=1 Tax=Roseimaritima ulvae TaxID=980254 RepID=A0A5B9R422_9BACT|nr:hypothetical protein [Roseimaritima ulvae]QEG41063.1 hypothetical protein UC8_30810 [Roseimaritima ulvae]
MTKQISPQLDAARRADWLRRQRLSDVDTPLRVWLSDCRLNDEEILELVCVDILSRTRATRPVDLEAYFTDFPALAEQPEAVLDIIDADICARREHRLLVPSTEYSKRFPALATRIARLIEIDTLETSLDEGTDFSFDEVAEPGKAPAERSPKNAAGQRAEQVGSVDAATAGGEFARYCSVELPADVRITGLLALREDVACLRASSSDSRGVLIKVVSKRRLTDSSLSDRIGDLLERLAKVTHPAWVPPDVIAENASQLVMVRPWVAGTLLTNRYLQNSPPTRNAAPPPPRLGLSPVLRELADLGYALAALHQQGLCHGALHPGNLFRDHDGNLRIVDAGFGFPDVGTQWDWRLPAAPLAGGQTTADDQAGQAFDAASLAKIIASALAPYVWTSEASVDTPLQRFVRWCQASGRAAPPPQCEVSRIADNLLALADGRPLKLPGSTGDARHSWWSRLRGREESDSRG